MLKFVLLKLLNKKWMVLALLIGNILLIFHDQYGLCHNRPLPLSFAVAWPCVRAHGFFFLIIADFPVFG